MPLEQRVSGRLQPRSSLLQQLLGIVGGRHALVSHYD
jgi:hypothetical protein